MTFHSRITRANISSSSSTLSTSPSSAQQNCMPSKTRWMNSRNAIRKSSAVPLIATTATTPGPTPQKKGGIQGVEYPLVSDLNKSIATEYGVLIPQEGIAYRGLFLIDGKGIVRHQVVNDLPLGRSVDETLRVLDALIYFEQHGEVCPADWKKGKKSMKPTQDGLEKYFSDTGIVA